MQLRLATFNIENLFTRFDFSAFTDQRSQSYLPAIVQFFGNFGTGDLTQFEEFKRFVQTAALSQDDDKRQHTALALVAADADIYCLQEVDSFDALSRFAAAYMRKIDNGPVLQMALHEGNDIRGIDVAVMAKRERAVLTRSHAMITGSWIDNTDSGKALLLRFKDAAKLAEKLKSERVFRRDCLEIETRIQNPSGSVDRTVSIFNCHFKSMSGGPRDDSIPMRQLEAITVREIITRKFEGDSNPLWAITGDLNDYRQVIKVRKADDGAGGQVEAVETLAADAPSGLDPLLQDGFGINTLDTLPQTDRWTHYYAGERHKTQLDYIIASPALFAMMDGPPRVIRDGQPYRVPNTDAIRRYPRVGWDRPKASDHCPVVVQFDIV